MTDTVMLSLAGGAAITAITGILLGVLVRFTAPRIAGFLGYESTACGDWGTILIVAGLMAMAWLCILAILDQRVPALDCLVAGIITAVAGLCAGNEITSKKCNHSEQTKLVCGAVSSFLLSLGGACGWSLLIHLMSRL